jgi:hypothetical protein
MKGGDLMVFVDCAPLRRPMFRALGAGALLSAVLAVSPRAEAQCSNCTAATDQPSAVVNGAWGFACVPGFVLADDNADGSASISMSVGANSISIDQTFTSTGCCVAPYANIGIFDACQGSDQYGQAGSHLPIQLKDIAMLKGAWTFKVPYPLNPDPNVEQYRVYFEIFLSSTAAGHTDAGNLTLVFFWSNYGFDPATGHAPINGPQGMDYIDYGNGGQGPFVDFLYPQGTFKPDANGVVTVDSTDVKAVLDWAVTKFPNYYNGNLYLSSLSLAEEAGAFHGNVHTSYASFAVEKTGSPVVYTPPFTSNHWTSTMSSSSSSTTSSSSSSTSSSSSGPTTTTGAGGSSPATTTTGAGGSPTATTTTGAGGAPTTGHTGVGGSAGGMSHAHASCTTAANSPVPSAPTLFLGALFAAGAVLRRRPQDRRRP